jgi:Skp family chaperone for outer membrane proteins
VRKVVAIFVSLSVFLVFLPFNLFPQEIKIGYVDIFEVFNEYKKTKDYDGELEARKKAEEKKLDKKKEEIEKMQDKLSLLKEDEQDKEKEKITDYLKEYRELERQIFTDLKKERDEKMKEIVEDIDKVIKEYAIREGLDLVINENAILYGSKGMDITSEILRQVNEKYKK